MSFQYHISCDPTFNDVSTASVQIFRCENYINVTQCKNDDDDDDDDENRQTDRL